MSKKAPPTPDELAIAERLKTARRMRGFNRAEDFAFKFGLKDSTYRSHESGRGIRKNLPLYAELLGVRFQWLFHGDGAMTEAEQAEVLELFRELLSLDDGNRSAVRHLIHSLAGKLATGDGSGAGSLGDLPDQD